MYYISIRNEIEMSCKKITFQKKAHMSVSYPEAAILSLFDTVAALTDYCMATNEQKDRIIKELLEKRKDMNMPGMTCTLDRR